MGSDHCPIALKLNVPVDGEAERRALAYTKKPLRQIADVADANMKEELKAGDDQVEKGGAQNPSAMNTSMHSLPMLGRPGGPVVHHFLNGTKHPRPKKESSKKQSVRKNDSKARSAYTIKARPQPPILAGSDENSGNDGGSAPVEESKGEQ